MRGRAGATAAAMTLTGRLSRASAGCRLTTTRPWLLTRTSADCRTSTGCGATARSEPVDLVVVGAGAGGITLAQRLARAGWRIVILEKGPFWDPDRDWVSDEKGAGPIYWTDKRIISGSDPSRWARTTPAWASAAR